MIDLDALEALEKKAHTDPAALVQLWDTFPELIRLARIGQREEANRKAQKEPYFLSQALNEGDGVYRP